MPRRIVLVLSALLLIAQMLVAQSQPRLLHEVSPGQAPVSSVTGPFFQVGNDLLFRAYHPATGYEWWRTDGTSAGTVLVKDILPGSGSPWNRLNLSGPATAFGGSLYFAASDGRRGSELWKSDGTRSGTDMVVDLAPDLRGVDPSAFAVLGQSLYFLGTTPDGNALYVTDGTNTNTTLVKLAGSGYRLELDNAGGTLFFFSDSGADPQLWSSDGTTAGTSAIATFTGGHAPPTSGIPSISFRLTPVGGNVFFVVCDPTYGCELRVSDGTAAGTHLVVDASPGSADSSFGDDFAELGGALLYKIGVGGQAFLSRSDGTAAGTTSLFTGVDLGPVRCGTHVYFSAADGLWRSDGTLAGTEQAWPAPPGVTVGRIAAAGSSLFFTTSDSSLWRHDEVSGANVLLATGSVPPNDTRPLYVGELGSEYYFAWDDGGGDGTELWKSDGTGAATAEVKNIAADAKDALITSFMRLPAAKVVFRNYSSPVEIWTSDGSDPGTIPLFSNDGFITDPVGLAPGAVFAANDTAAGVTKLWFTDLTSSGTTSIAEYPNTWAIDDVGLLGSTAYFGVQGSTESLWSSDGSASGTASFVDIPGYSSFWFRRAIGNLLFFDIYGGPYSREEIWRTDGTAAGTFGLGVPASASSHVQPLNGWTFLELFTSAEGAEPAITDGTVAGTHVIKDIVPGSGGSIPSAQPSCGGWFVCLPSPVASSGTRVFFVANDGVHGTELWTTDGTSDGTQLVDDILPGPSGSIPSSLTTIGNEVFFSADDGVHGQELWKSDGAAAGTTMVKDIVPGAEGSSLSEMIRIGSSVWFQANDPDHGMELWRSDGTAAGTQLVADINTGSGSSDPAALATSGGTLFFTAYTDGLGVEPWVLDLNPEVDSISPTSGDPAGGSAVTIHGWSFAPDATVRFDATDASTQTVVDDWTMTTTSPAFEPGTLHDVTVRNGSTLEGTLANAWFADFLDVPASHPFHPFVEKLVRNGITSGCGGGMYCVSTPVTRAQMAVFLLRSRYGPSYEPPPATGTLFADVPAGSFAAAWIEELYAEGVTAGCGVDPLRFCPGAAVTRGQSAVFLLRMKEGASYLPPPAVGIFADVPPSSGFAPWIEELYNRGITGGCAVDPPQFCPGSSTTRGQMSVFVVTTFGM